MKLNENILPRTKKILFADDNATIRHVFAKVLANDGYQVQAVADGAEAWLELQRQNFDLLITDDSMPYISGQQLVAKLRHSGVPIPVIVISGTLTDAALAQWSQFEIAAKFAKPFSLLDFLGAVRAALMPSPQTALSPDPLHLPALRADQGRVPDRKKSSRNHVLVAEDDAVVRSSLVAVLQSEGYRVAEASDGFEAINQAIHHEPDLVLLDLNMPNADGWTAFRQIDRVAPLLPVIVITARPNQYPEAVRVGVDAFMEKPLNIPVLMQAIKRLASEDKERHEQRITERDFVTQWLGHE